MPGLSADDEDVSSTVVTPKRNNLSRLAIQRNAEKRSASDLPFRAGRDTDDDRPSYSKDYLSELKQSTPSTPKDLLSRSTTPNPEDSSTQALDIASKFGSDLSRYKVPTAIPTDAEIQEKKARRARLAKENDFISLEDNSENSDEDDENVTRDDTGRLILKPKEKYPETRLVRDDEDILEDFDDFTTDGKISLGRKAEKEAAVRRKAEMAAMIASAEGVSGDDEDGEEEDDSEVERNAAFEVAQTRHGNYAARAQEDQQVARPRTPPRIAPLPTLDGVVDRLRKRLVDMQAARMEKMREMQSLVDEKRQIGEEEVRVQNALKETAEKYAQLRLEKGVKASDSQQLVAPTNGDAADGFGPRLGLGGAGLGSMGGRGLDSLGGTPVRVGSDYSSDS